jgi:hypothetical protein
LTALSNQWEIGLVFQQADLCILNAGVVVVGGTGEERPTLGAGKENQPARTNHNAQY